MDVARRVVVHGIVQGVGFRWNTARTAEALGVTGWVRNSPDGTVLCHVEGDRAAVDRMVAWLRHGPRSAEVTGVDVTEAEPMRSGGFETR